MPLNLKQLNLYAISLFKKNCLCLQEKRFLRFFGLFKHVAIKTGEVNTKLRPHEFFNFLCTVKNRFKLKRLKTVQFFSFMPYPYSFYIGSEKQVYVCSNGQIFVFKDKKFLEKLEFKIGKKNIFENSLVVNAAQKTLLINKNFCISIFISKNNFVVKSALPFDCSGLKTFSLCLGKNTLKTTQKAHHSLNQIFCNAVRIEKTMPQSYLIEVKNISEYAKFLNIKNTAEIAKLFNVNLNIGAVFLNKSFTNKTSAVNGVMFCFKTKYYKFYNTFKFNVESGTYFFVKNGNDIKMQINKEKISLKMLEAGSCVLNGFEAITLAKPHFFTNNTKFQFCTNPIEFARELWFGFFAQTEFNNHAKESLKQLLKEKRCLKQAAAHLLTMSTNAKTANERKRLFKLSALISRLPERQSTKKTATEIVLEKRFATSNTCAKISV